MLNINFDEETEKYLVEILAQEKTTSTELIKRLLRQHWQTLQSRPTVLERMGGYPEHLLNGLSDLSDRDVRQKIIGQDIHEYQEQNTQIQELYGTSVEVAKAASKEMQNQQSQLK